MTAKSVGFIGGGRVTHIILGGWKKAGRMPAKTVVGDINSDILNRLQGSYPGIQIVHNDNRMPAGHSGGIRPDFHSSGADYLDWRIAGDGNRRSVF